VTILASGRRRYTIAAVHDATAQPALYTALAVDPEDPDAAGNKQMIAINERLGFAEFPPAWQSYQIPVATLLN
jgi:hypothetical protein